MKDKFFLDTNIIVYSFSSDERKKIIAQDLIDKSLKTKKGVISYQVVQEFLNVALKKFDNPFSTSDAQLFLNFVLLPICTVHSSFTLFDQALKVKENFKFSLYDSLIIASALEAKCNIVYSEDLQHGQKVMGIEIVDPFTKRP